MKSVLITGGAGFIGQNLVKYFIKKYRVIVLDNLSSKGVAKEYLFKKNKVKFITKDISRFSDISQALKNIKIDYVIHAAANFANENSVLNPVKDLKSNILGTLNVLELSKKKKIKKFIYLSSSCVYGDNVNVKENSKINPNETPYAISKFSGELYVQYFKYFHKLNTVIVRVFNTYGPGEINHKFRNVIPRFIENALNNKNLLITGNGHESRDFTYVEDLVKVINLIIKSKNSLNVINSCTGKKTKIINLAKLIIKLTKSKSQITFGASRKWDKIKKRSGSNILLKKFYKFNKYTKLEHGLYKTINWYKKNIYK